VCDGFARGGVMIFEIEQLERGDCMLSIYVAFDYALAGGRSGGLVNRLIRLLFPAFLHDVVWNHSLCQLKDVVESSQPSGDQQPMPVAVRTGPAMVDQAGSGCLRWIE
jgi:hypothetical protein